MIASKVLKTLLQINDGLLLDPVIWNAVVILKLQTCKLKMQFLTLWDSVLVLDFEFHSLDSVWALYLKKKNDSSTNTLHEDMHSFVVAQNQK